jgi:hypothetical protein
MKENPELKSESFYHPKVFVQMHTYQNISDFFKDFEVKANEYAKLKHTTSKEEIK